jgi:hypothetical protein
MKKCSFAFIIALVCLLGSDAVAVDINQSLGLFANPPEKLPCKKTRFTFGAGLYKYPSVISVNGMLESGGYDETLYAFNFGMEISKATEMKFKNGWYTDTRIDINATTLMDMQVPYYNRNANGEYSSLGTLFLTKNYLTIGLISEVRKKNNSFLMSFAPGLNINRGYWTGSEKISDTGGAVQMGEYLQHNFFSSEKNRDSMFIRIGFEQFFSFGKGYIGQFVLTFGI